MKIFSKIKNSLLQAFNSKSVDIAEINIFGIGAEIIHKTQLPVSHEVSVYIPRLEITQKVIEGNKTSEVSLVLNSLTIVSAPRDKLLKCANPRE